MRARMLRLHHKTASKLLRLKTLAEKEGASRVARRIHAVILNSEGYTSGELASLLKVGRLWGSRKLTRLRSGRLTHPEFSGSRLRRVGDSLSRE